MSARPRAPSVVDVPPLQEYSPTAARTLQFCEKCHYFHWLNRHKQGWRKPRGHPWHRVHVLSQLKHRHMWAGELYHQVLAWALEQVRNTGAVDTHQAHGLARRLAAAQYRYSAQRRFDGAVKRRVETIDGISVHLALFEHVYGLPAGAESPNDVVAQMQQKINGWLATTFTSSTWATVVREVPRALAVYIEPSTLYYTLGEARIAARMDLGIEGRDGTFAIYDWKCHAEQERFVAWDRRLATRQLLAYALWPVERTRRPLSLEAITGHIFNPTTGEELVVRFTEDDRADFELEVDWWARAHAQTFVAIDEVEFDDLRGPWDPGRSCPWCPFKGVCGQEIPWHSLS